MSWESLPIMDLLDVFVSALKDRANRESIENVRRAALEIVKADADARRDKSCAVIREIAKMDAAKRRIAFQRSRWTDLSPEAESRYEQFMRGIDKTIDALRREKRRLERAHVCR